ncbi:hypothetical protein ACO0LG_07320 [Undibacterium sp. Ji42W]
MIRMIKEMVLEGTGQSRLAISKIPFYYYLHKKHAYLGNRVKTLLRKNY